MLRWAAAAAAAAGAAAALTCGRVGCSGASETSPCCLSEPRLYLSECELSSALKVGAPLGDEACPGENGESGAGRTDKSGEACAAAPAAAKSIALAVSAHAAISEMAGAMGTSAAAMRGSGTRCGGAPVGCAAKATALMAHSLPDPTVCPLPASSSASAGSATVLAKSATGLPAAEAARERARGECARVGAADAWPDSGELRIEGSISSCCCARCSVVRSEGA